MHRQKIVTFGGGTGHFNLLNGLKKFNLPSYITAVVSTWDSGGSSGVLRTELGVLPPGDARRCILALMENEQQQRVAQRLFDDRLEDMDKPLRGHSLGNLIGARLERIYRGQDRGLDAQRALFRIRAKIFPASLSDLELIAITESGIEIEGESSIDRRAERKDYSPEDKIARIYFNTRADANPAVIKSLAEAEKIVFAPGDLFSSILPHLLITGVREAIETSPAKLIFIVNLMTKPGETDFFRASDFVERFLFYLDNPKRLDFIIVNKQGIHNKLLDLYKAGGQNLVSVDEAKIKKIAPSAKVIKANLIKYFDREHLIRHDSEALARVVLSL